MLEVAKATKDNQAQLDGSKSATQEPGFHKSF